MYDTVVFMHVHLLVMGALLLYTKPYWPAYYHYYLLLIYMLWIQSMPSMP